MPRRAAVSIPRRPRMPRAGHPASARLRRPYALACLLAVGVLALTLAVTLAPALGRVVHAASNPLQPSAMPLISQGLPAYTNDNNAYDPSLADGGNYGAPWNSVDTPTTASPIWLALDLSSVPLAQRQHDVVAWFNDTSDYLQLPSTVYYNLPSAYTLDVNNGAGGGNPPTSGWITLKSVSVTSTDEAAFLLTLSGANWLRMNITATKGSSGNYAAMFNLDVYDAEAGATDGWLFMGDSITAEGMAHGNIAGGPWTGGDYAQLVNAAAAPYYPLQYDAGIGGWTSADGAANISKFLATFGVGRYVSLAFGTNDANEPFLLSASDIQTYYHNMLTMIAAVQQAGDIAVVPFVPWGCSGDLGPNAAALNSYVTAHLATDAPQAVRGPDLYTPFSQNHGWIDTDCIHPTYSAPSGQLNGFEQYQRVWAAWATKTIYTSAAPTPTPTTVPPTATATATHTPTPTPTNTPTPAPTATPTNTPTPTATPTPIAINDVPCVVTINGQQESGTCSGTFTP